MSDKTTPKVGKLLDGTEGRDAIHFALAPVMARHDLMPGDDVGLFPDGSCGYSGEHIGIVDPFLQNEVLQGELFWLFLYPGTITNLRHVWEHPAFKTKIPNKKDE